MSVDFPQPEGALITMKRGFMSMARIVYHRRMENGEWKMREGPRVSRPHSADGARMTWTTRKPREPLARLS